MDINKLPHDHGDGALAAMEGMPADSDFQTVADIFKLICDGSRIKIFWLLCHCEQCVINIANIVKMTSPAVSHHLRQLKSSGLVVSRKVGKEVYYKAADSERARMLHLMIEKMVEISCPSDFPLKAAGQAGDEK